MIPSSAPSAVQNLSGMLQTTRSIHQFMSLGMDKDALRVQRRDLNSFINRSIFAGTGVVFAGSSAVADLSTPKLQLSQAGEAS